MNRGRSERRWGGARRSPSGLSQSQQREGPTRKNTGSWEAGVEVNPFWSKKVQEEMRL